MFKTNIKFPDNQYLPENVDLMERTFNSLDNAILYIDKQLEHFLDWLQTDQSCKNSEPIFEINTEYNSGKGYYCAIVDINHGDAKCTFEVKEVKQMDNSKKIKIERFIVTAVDYGDSCDGKARILFSSQFEDEAKAYVENDITDYVDNATDDDGNCPYTVDFNKMKVTVDNSNDGCEWNIEKVIIEFSIDELDKSLFNLN